MFYILILVSPFSIRAMLLSLLLRTAAESLLVVLVRMADNVDWLPFSGGRLDEMIQSTFTSLYDTVMDETKSFLTRMNAELMQWIDLDEEKRICKASRKNIKQKTKGTAFPNP